MNDRRGNIRYKLKEGCIVIHDEAIGTINDISTSGFSCSCLNDVCSRDVGRKIDILCRQHRILAERIHIKILETECQAGEFLKGLTTRKCRVRFKELTQRQKNRLENVLSTYTYA